MNIKLVKLIKNKKPYLRRVGSTLAQILKIKEKQKMKSCNKNEKKNKSTFVF